MKKKIQGGFESKRFVMRFLTPADYGVWRAAHLAVFPRQNEFDEEKRSSKELTKAEYNKMLRKFKKFTQKKIIYPYAVFEKKTGRHMGMVMISLVLRYNVQSARIAYSIFNNYWKHGYGKEVAGAAFSFAFRKLRLHRLEAEILPHNRASISLAKSLGMEFEGLRRRAVYFQKKWHDHVIYAITAEDLGIKNTKPRIFD